MHNQYLKNKFSMKVRAVERSILNWSHLIKFWSDTRAILIFKCIKHCFVHEGVSEQSSKKEQVAAA
jgi:hypothetical protein